MRMDWNRPRKLLAAWLAVSALLGVVLALAPSAGRDGRLLQVVVGLPASIFIYLWCRADSISRGIVPMSRTIMLSALLAPFATPLYFLRTRKPLWRAFVDMLKALAFYLATFLAALSSSTIAGWSLR